MPTTERLAHIRRCLSTDRHPFSQLEQVYGITAAEAARRLGVSVRQYYRYKAGDPVPETVRLLVELGALSRPRTDMSIDRRIQQWTDRQS